MDRITEDVGIHHTVEAGADLEGQLTRTNDTSIHGADDQSHVHEPGSKQIATDS